MNHNEEGLCLSLEEIMAIISISGRETVVGFWPEEIIRCTPERLLGACCGLMQEQMLTVIDGKFRLCGRLAAVMQPLCTADRVLAVTGGTDHPASVNYYLGKDITALERKATGGFVLTQVAPDALLDDMAQRLQLTMSDLQDTEDTGDGPDATARWDFQHEVPMKKSYFLLECLDAGTAQPNMWLRLTTEGTETWIQMACAGDVIRIPFTQRTLKDMLDQIVRGGVKA